jgi:hypothetical protein
MLRTKKTKRYTFKKNKILSCRYKMISHIVPTILSSTSPSHVPPSYKPNTNHHVFSDLLLDVVELCFQSCIVSVELVYVYSRLINHCGSLQQLINLSGMKYFQPSQNFLPLPTSLQSENNEIHEETGERMNNCC